MAVRTSARGPPNYLGSVLDVHDEHSRDEEDGSNGFRMLNLDRTVDQAEDQEIPLRNQKDVVALELRNLEQQ